MQILGPDLQHRQQCEGVLRSVSSWFGIEDALVTYAADSERMPTFALASGNSIVGFLTLLEHFPRSWEIHCMAIQANMRNSGHGSRLLQHAENWLIHRGVQFLQVKTVAHTSKSTAYAETREFYSAKGFASLEIFPTLWHPRNPALQLIKVLDTGSQTRRNYPEHPVQLIEL